MSTLIQAILAVTTLSYIPPVDDIPSPPFPPIQEEGIGTVYGLGGYHGPMMANGETFKPKEEATCAHKSIPLGTRIKVTSPDSKESIWCEVTDRGPYVVKTFTGQAKAVTPQYELQYGERWVRILDLSVKAARKLGVWGKFDVTVSYYSWQVDQ